MIQKKQKKQCDNDVLISFPSCKLLYIPIILKNITSLKYPWNLKNSDLLAHFSRLSLESDLRLRLKSKKKSFLLQQKEKTFYDVLKQEVGKHLLSFFLFYKNSTMKGLKKTFQMEK